MNQLDNYTKSFMHNIEATKRIRPVFGSWLISNDINYECYHTERGIMYKHNNQHKYVKSKHTTNRDNIRW